MSFEAKSIEAIEIVWDGPYDFEQAIKKSDQDEDYGVYQLYGTHLIFGSDAILYIGKARDRTFSVRLKEHKKYWVDWEASKLQIYLGRIGGLKPARAVKGEWRDWETQIDRVERLLVYYCAPPYNSSGLNGFGKMKPTILMNYGVRHRLPFEVSTLYDCGEYAMNPKDWKAYTTSST